MAANRKGGKDRTLDDVAEEHGAGELVTDPEDELGPDPEHKAALTDTRGELELADAAAALDGLGMAGIDYTRRRYGMAGAGFVSTAAGKAEDARGGEPGDLVVLSIPAGELGRVMGLLEALGVRRPDPTAG